MGRKMGLISIILKMMDPTRSSSSSSSSPSVSSPPSTSSWAWASCKHPRTLSFRAGEDVYKTVNSIYFDTTDHTWQTHSSSSSAEEEEEEEAHCQRFSTALEEEEEEEEEKESKVIQGLRSDRLFFEPRGKTSSILEEPKTITSKAESVVVAGEEEEMVPFKESVAEEMESEDPYLDFRVSMEEMVVAHGLKDWECLEELLGWYLRMNGKKTHGFILGAFVDLLLDLASSFQPSSSFCSSCSCSCSCSSSSSTTTTTTSSSSVKFVVKEHERVKVNDEEDHHVV